MGKINIDEPLNNEQRDGIVTKASSIFMSRINPDEYPEDHLLETARLNTEDYIVDEYINNNQSLINKTNNTVDSISSLRLEIAPWLRINPLKIPKPPKHNEVINWRIALSSLIGTIIGLYIILLLFSSIIKNPESRIIAMFIGGPLGAFSFVMLSLYLSKNRGIKNSLLVGIGLFAVVDVVQLFKSSGGIRGLWSKIRGKQKSKNLASFFKRCIIYILVLFVVLLSKMKISYDFASYREIVKNSIELWFDKLDLHIKYSISNEQTSLEGGEENLIKLIDFFSKFGLIPENDLSKYKQEWFLIAEEMGLDISEANTGKQEEFPWKNEYEEKYEKYGLIEEGDNVFVQNQALTINGKTVKKGLVRKVRK